MPRVIGQILAFLLITLFLTIFVFLEIQSRLLTGARRILSATTPAEFALTYEEFRIQTFDNIYLEGWLIEPQENLNPKKAILFTHGLSSNRTHFIQEARHFVNNGYIAVVYDMRAHGTSDGKYSTLGSRESHDILQIIEYLAYTKDIHNVVLVAESTGGVASILAAAKSKDVAGVITISAFSSVENMVTDFLARIGLPAFAARVSVRWMEWSIRDDLTMTTPLTEIHRIAPRPVTIIHGGRDTTIPLENARSLHKAAGTNASLWIVPEAGHGTVGWLRNEQYFSLLDDFVSGAFEEME